MALIEAVFRRKSSERTLTFQEIAEETHTQLAEVEHLVMKALRCVHRFIVSSILLASRGFFQRVNLRAIKIFFFLHSLKLIQGDIDQVDSKAHITWVQPRVLSRQQIEGLAGNLTSWIDKMTKLQEYVDKEQVSAF